MRNKGFSLLELMVIIAIIAVLMAIAMPQLSKYYKQYKVEDEINTLYGQLMNQRFKSMNSGVPHGVRFDSQNQYTLFEFNDANYNLKFDGTSEEKNPSTISVSYPLTGVSSIPVVIFNREGMAKTATWGLSNLTIRIDFSARYNCIVISSSRIKLGVWDGSNCKVK